ncbi:MAG: DUF58 domain-containing protein [Steroidobacteraceae bacterium]|nr:DUF58 domain-containing protein [Steroidobacteraceae bacterium]
MNATPAARLLTPEVLAGLANLELVARTAVEGFLVGLHRSPRFGFSQEFAEFRAYVEGDDPRFVDWNVFARTERTYVRRYQGETNTRLFVLLDASASMAYQSATVSKLQYGKYLAAALAYLASRQHDPVGLIVFDESIRHYRPPSSRAGSLQGVLHALDSTTPGKRTDIEGCFLKFREHMSRRGLVAVISDLYCDPVAMSRAVQPLAYTGHDIMFFHVLDPGELEPRWRDSVLFEDMESGQTMEVSPEYLESRYQQRLLEHLDGVRKAAGGMGADLMLARTDEPLDRALRRYLMFRQRH